MNVFLLLVGFVLCVSGVIRGSARIRQRSLHSTTAVALFWSSLVGCLSAVSVIVATVLIAATFDEARDMNPVFSRAWSYAMSTLRVSSGASFILHLVLFLTPAHGIPPKSNIA